MRTGRDFACQWDDTRFNRVLAAVVFWLLRRLYRDTLRTWIYTDKRPPNGVDEGAIGDEVSVNFCPEMLASRRALHDQLDQLINTAHATVADPERNVWRLGQLRLRWRTGVAKTEHEFGYLGLNLDGSERKESA